MNIEDKIKEIEKLCLARRVKGAKEYGDLSFLKKANLKELKEELCDSINYAKFEIIKVDIISERLEVISESLDIISESLDIIFERLEVIKKTIAQD